MNILISFCNTIDTPGYPNLGVINIETKEFNVIALPPEINQTGMLGLALSSKYLFAGLQHVDGGVEGYNSPPALLIFNRLDLKLVSSYRLTLVKDIHSFLLLKDEKTLYIVSSGTDDIIRLHFEDSNVISEEIFWSPSLEDYKEDTFHINSINAHKGDILVSGFGLKEIPDDWNSAHNGFIYNVTRGKEIISGLEQPHSIDVIGNHIAFCESRTKKIRFIGEERSLVLPGYARGLCHHDDHLYVGTSASRKKSKSTGKPTIGTAISPGGCTISQVNVKTLEIGHSWDLNDYAVEIYELMLVPDVSLWPLEVPRNYREEFQHSWMYRTQLVAQEIRDTVTLGETILLVDDGLLQISERMLPGYQILPFIENAGQYWGSPADDGVGISELERMRHSGAKYIVFAWPSFWWLDHYKSLHQYLKQHYSLVAETENAVVFNLEKT